MMSNQSTTAAPPDRQGLAGRAMLALFSAAWLLAFFSLFGITAWIGNDPLFDDSCHWLVEEWTDGKQQLLTNSRVVGRQELDSRPAWIAGTLLGALVINLTCVVGLIVGPRGFRRLISWLGIFTLTAGWTTLLLNWKEVAWRGEGLQIGRQLERFEPLVDELHNDWPTVDGDSESFGAYSAYPYGRARLLLLLEPPDPVNGFGITAIERSKAGAVRFQLSGQRSGKWIEWHPDESTPKSFVGGLSEPYQLVRSLSLGEGWYLSEYSSGR